MAISIKSYEKKYAALEEIVRNLDQEDLSLNDMLTQYKKGLTLVRKSWILWKVRFNRLSRKFALQNKELAWILKPI